MKMKIGRNPSTQTHLRELIGNKGFCEVDPEEDRQLRLEPGFRDRDGPRDGAL
jgi:hypothetical protein